MHGCCNIYIILLVHSMFRTSMTPINEVCNIHASSHTLKYIPPLRKLIEKCKFENLVSINVLYQLKKYVELSPLYKFC